MKPRAITESLVKENRKIVWRVPLTQGKFALIDDEDYKLVSLYNWRWLSTRNYAQTSIQQNGTWRTIQMHRLILNAPKGVEVDHVNGNGLNNRRSNIRLCTRSENMRNRRGWKLNESWGSSFKGVHRMKDGRFRAQIFLGTFDTELEAAHAYNEAARILFGAFAKLNFLSHKYNYATRTEK